MTPALAGRGRLLAALAGLFVAFGAAVGAWPFVALGTILASALATVYLAFAPTALLVRRRKVELAWWVPPGAGSGAHQVDQPFAARVLLRNHGPRRLRIDGLTLVTSSALEPASPTAVDVPPRAEVEVVVGLRARAAGHATLHGAVIVFSDALGLFEARAYFPNPIGVKVFPRLVATRAERAMLRPPVSPLEERAGLQPIRRRGLAGELREIREHAHGDAFKFIAWKATARRRRLMVRDLETELVVTRQLVVDTGAAMRSGTLGRRKLDWAIETAAGLARLALEDGDRVGAVTFDTRVTGHVPPDEGRPHLLPLVDRLLDAQQVVDADLTDVTDGELVATVARYVAHQEAVDVRRAKAPPKGDPDWERLAAGPDGVLYDLGALDRVARVLLEAAGQHRLPTEPLARLRLLCRARGLELPYRGAAEDGARARGLAEALTRAAAGGRGHAIFLVSDLDGLFDEPEAALRALSIVRRRHPIVAIAPFGPSFAAPPGTEHGRRVADVLAAEERRRLDAARRELARHGVPVLVTGPEDALPQLARRLARLRDGARRVRA